MVIVLQTAAVQFAKVFRPEHELMTLGIRPTVDFAFKLMLGSPEHTAVTVHFLNAVLNTTPPITNVQILNPILGKETDDSKLLVLDVRAEDASGRQFNIEMQASLVAGLADRLAYYASSLYVSQLSEGETYPSLRPAITICVLEQSLFPLVPRLHLDFQLRATDGLLLTENLQVHRAGCVAAAVTGWWGLGYLLRCTVRAPVLSPAGARGGWAAAECGGEVDLPACRRA